MRNSKATLHPQHIDMVGADGYGVALDHSGYKIPFTLENEAVHVEDTSFGKHPAWGKVVDIITPSPHRISPACPHFTSCGGCVLQHLDKQRYVDFKKNLIIDYLKAENIDVPKIADPIIIGPHKRRRADYKAGYGREGFRLGFTAFKGTYISDMDHCPAIHKDLEALIPDLKTFLKEALIPFERVHIFQTRADNGIDLLITGLKRPFAPVEITKLQEMAARHPICRLRLKTGKKYQTLIQTEEPKIHFGTTAVSVSCNSFLQASKESDQILSDLVLKSIQDNQKIKHVADLFCGRGTLSLPLMDAGFKVDGFESDPHALAALTSLSLDEDKLKIWSRNLFSDPLSASELDKYDHVVINPPRAGAETQSAELGKSNVTAVTYVSCSPQTFARDARILTNAGYELELITPVDQFIWTPHVEVVAIFKR